MAEASSTPSGTKRKKKDGTPTPVHEALDTEAKKSKGEPIPMANLDNNMDTFEEIGDPEPGTEPTKSYAKIVMEQQQREAMKLAPPWAKVILSVIKENITELGHTSGELSRSIVHNDTRIKDLIDDNTALTRKVDKQQNSIDDLSLRFAKM